VGVGAVFGVVAVGLVVGLRYGVPVVRGVVGSLVAPALASGVGSVVSEGSGVGSPAASVSGGSGTWFVVGTPIAIGALDETPDALLLGGLPRSRNAAPPPSSAAKITTPIQRPRFRPLPSLCGGGGRTLELDDEGPSDADGNIDRSMPPVVVHGLEAGPAISACGGGGGGLIPPAGTSIRVVGMCRESTTSTFMSGEIRTFDMSIVFRRCRFGSSVGPTYARASFSPCEVMTPSSASAASGAPDPS